MAAGWVTANNLAVPTRPFVSGRDAPVGGGGGGVRSFESAAGPHTRAADRLRSRGVGPPAVRLLWRANERVGRRINTGSRRGRRRARPGRFSPSRLGVWAASAFFHGRPVGEQVD